MESAYHESGHAVVATLLGGRVLQAAIDLDQLNHAGREAIVEVEWNHRQYSAEQLIRCEILTALAGPAAEMNYRGEPLHPRGVSEWQADWAIAKQLAAQLVSQSRWELQSHVCEQMLETICAELFQILGGAECWQAIAELADLLDAHQVVEGDEVRECVRRWITG